MSNGYGINAFGTYDYMSLMNDPALMAALQSYNPNSLAFKGTQQTPVQNQATDLSTTIGADLSSVANPSFKAAAPTDEGNGLLYTGAAATALAVGAIVCAKKGNGKGFAKVVDGFKTIFKGKPTRAMKDFTLSTKDGSRIVVENGKVVSIRTMGKETVIDKDVATYIRNNGIATPVKSAIDTKTGKLAENAALGSFTIKFNNKTYLIEDGQIVKAFDRKGKEIKGKTIDEILGGDKDKLNNKLTKIINGEEKLGSAVKIKKYTITDAEGRVYELDGRNAFTRMTIPSKLEKPLSEAEQKAWLNLNSETDAQIQELISKGRSEGIKIDSNKFTDDSGNKLLIDANGEITAIVLKKKPKTGPQVLKKGSTEFDAWLYDNKEVKAAAEREIKSGLAGEGSRFMAA